MRYEDLARVGDVADLVSRGRDPEIEVELAAIVPDLERASSSCPRGVERQQEFTHGQIRLGVRPHHSLAEFLSLGELTGEDEPADLGQRPEGPGVVAVPGA